MVALLFAASAWGCARVATSGHRTAGDPDAMSAELPNETQAKTPFSSTPIDDNPFSTEQALKDVPIIKHALEQPRFSTKKLAAPKIDELAPNPFPVRPKKKPAGKDQLDPSTIAVEQLMMKEADANLQTDLDAAPEPDFRGMGKGKRSAASSASAEVELDVVSYLARQHRSIKTCYEMGLAVDPSIEGKVTVKFKVTRKGKVKRPRVVQSELPRSVERCIVHTLTRLDFPGNDDPSVTFEYPFFFSR